MTTAAIIAEFNPFHNGHSLIIERAKEAGADRVIVLMSGDYVQRGSPALFGRDVRARMALLSGADVVLACPTRFATASAESFASHAVAILDALGIVDILVFGSECGDLTRLDECASFLNEETAEYKEQLSANLKSGMNFAKARSEAAGEYADILKGSNNILAIEYLKALKALKSRICPMTVTREGSAYGDEMTFGELCSAAAIRRRLRSGDPPDEILMAVPECSREVFRMELSERGTTDASDYSLLLLSKLMEARSAEELFSYQDVTADLANTLYNRRFQFTGFEEYASLCRSRSLTESHVRRALLHITIGIRKDEVLDRTLITEVLGFRREAVECISRIKKNASLTVLMNPASESIFLDREEKRLFAEEVRVSQLYESLRGLKAGGPIRNVLSKELLKV